MVTLKILDGGSLGPDAQTINGNDLAAVSEIHDGRGNTEKTAFVAVDHIQGQTHRYPSINGVAALA
jgi:hypothetical protein